MAQAAPIPDRARIAEHLANLRAVVGGERSPLGRAWNYDMSKSERVIWARLGGLGYTDSRVIACREWADIDAAAQAAIRGALTRAAVRANAILRSESSDAA